MYPVESIRHGVALNLWLRARGLRLAPSGWGGGRKERRVPLSLAPPFLGCGTMLGCPFPTFKRDGVIEPAGGLR